MSSKSSRKRSAVNDYEEDGGFVVNGDASEGESRAKTGKKAKTTGASKIGKEKASSGDDEQYWELSDKRRVSIEKYGGRTLISIREFYDKGGELLPSKKVSAHRILDLYLIINLELAFLTEILGNLSFDLSVRSPLVTSACT